MPLQTVSFGLAEIVIVGVTVGLTTILILLLLTEVGTAHGALLTKIQRTESPFEGLYA